MKKINIILIYLEKENKKMSGGMQVIFRYAKELTELGYDVKLYAPIIPYDLHRNECNLNRIIKRLKGFFYNLWYFVIKNNLEKYYKDYDIKYVLKIDKSIREADYVFATAWPTAFDVAKMNISKGKKVYFIQDYEIWDNELLGKKTYELPLKKVVISSWIKSKLIEQGVNDNIELITNGIDFDFYKQDIIKENKKNINCLMLAHTLPKKGVKNGIEAFEKAFKRKNNISLTLFGTKTLNNIPSNVEFILNPNSEKIRDLYRKTDIFIYPSISEGWGMTVIEAMCARCAVVGTNTGCLIDIGEDGKNALISEPNDIDKMANDIVMLANDYQLRVKVGNNAYDTVKKFDWKRSAKLMDEYLKKI